MIIDSAFKQIILVKILNTTTNILHLSRENLLNDNSIAHQNNTPVKSIPLTPKFYTVKLGLTGIYIFLIFALKHRLQVICEAVLTSVFHVNFLCKGVYQLSYFAVPSVEMARKMVAIFFMRTTWPK